MLDEARRNSAALRKLELQVRDVEELPRLRERLGKLERELLPATDKEPGLRDRVARMEGKFLQIAGGVTVLLFLLEAFKWAWEHMR